MKEETKKKNKLMALLTATLVGLAFLQVVLAILQVIIILLKLK